jgi:hypothetical protein
MTAEDSGEDDMAVRKVKLKDRIAASRPKAKVGSAVYVAVVVRINSDPKSGISLTSYRDDARFSAALGHDKAMVVEEGMALVAKYGRERYELWVGKMSEKIALPKPKYEVVKL